MNAPLGFFDSNASGLIRNRLDGGAAELLSDKNSMFRHMAELQKDSASWKLGA